MGARLVELWRIFGSLGAVVAAVVAGLWVLDGVPALLGGKPRDVLECQDLRDAERRLGIALYTPVYFPEALAWPPERVAVLLGPPPSALFSFRSHSGASGVVQMLQVFDAGPVPERLWPAAQVLTTSKVTVDDKPAQVRRVLAGDGTFWFEVEASRGAHHFFLRGRGDIANLVRMRHSLEHAAR